ncbi:MAG: iron-containing alcohol dehydrogenase [archaeon]|nr:iron-containing alcohol dehydrogenase [archaeon]
MDFSYYVPANIKFGRGKADTVGKEVSKYGRKALIVTGKSSGRTGLLERMEKQLENEHVEYVVFDKITANPLTTSVQEGAALLNETGCDSVLAVGGGSPLDAAKGISLLAKNGGELDDYIFKRVQGDFGSFPIIDVPTTCGTGSESNGTAVLSNPVTLDKKSISYPSLVAKCSIVDPSLMETMPKSVVGPVTFDAMCHAMEAYLSPGANPFTDSLAVDAMLYVSKYIVRANDDIHDEEAVDAMTLASTMAGASFYVAGLIATHGMEHPLSGMKNIAHGTGLAALTPLVYEHSIPGNPERFAFVSRIFGGNDENDCARTIRRLLSRIDMETYLSDH